LKDSFLGFPGRERIGDLAFLLAGGIARKEQDAQKCNNQYGQGNWQ
jgi:hypothetical protein